MGIMYDDDVAVITGAGRGLGRAHALLLAELGARVVVNDIGGATDGQGHDDGPAAAVVKEITDAGGIAIADTHDGSTVAGAHALIETAVNAFGRVDAVVANAGILRDKTFHKVTDEDFFAVVNVHLAGTVRVFHAAYPLMREQGYGRLVATASAAGLFGNFGQTSYAAAKMGIVGFTRSLALEGAKSNVKANVIAPMARTRMTEELAGDLAERLQPEKVSPLVAYLCHRSNDHTGQIFSVGAGRIARVGVGVGRGLTSTDLDVDQVAATLDEVLREQDLVYPAHIYEETQMLLEQHGSEVAS
jgi:NAD(P)-dependent dehydrogenase (short-subunit alcohol dehydrogenase family)